MQYYMANTSLIEIPDHVSLRLLILGCPIHCPDCHSKWTWDKSLQPQTEITIHNIEKLLSYHDCILFFGGEWEEDFYSTLIAFRQFNLPLALYTGRHLVNCVNEPWFKELTYIKTGPYRKEKGGLKEKGTNQHLYKLSDGAIKEELKL